MEEAAREHLERLGGEQQRGEEGVRQPLEDLADLHELMKDFNQFKRLFEAQRQMAEQTERLKDKAQLDQADRLSLQEMAARERQLGTELQQLRHKLDRDAEAAREKFPQAAQSAQDLGDAIERAAMPSLARGASQKMLKGDGPGSHHRAENLKNEMADLFSAGGGQPGAAQAQQGLDSYLQLTRGMNPGNSFQQMMQNLGMNEGQGGGGAAGMGMMAMGGEDGQPQGLMGGEATLNGPIQSRIAGRGRGDRFGLPGGGRAEVDRESSDHTAANSTRETSTPDAAALLQEYESLTDAYFRQLTNPTSENR